MSWIQSKCFDTAAEIIHDLHLNAQHLRELTIDFDKFTERNTENERSEIQSSVIKELTRIQNLYAHAITPCGLEIFAPVGKPTVIDTFRESIARIKSEPINKDSWIEIAKIINHIATKEI